MTNEEKQLLLKDLCARLPYGVKFVSFSKNMKYHSEPTTLREIFYYKEYGSNIIEGDNDISSILDFTKPYLRPISSMTDEEKILMSSICLKHAYGDVERMVSEFSEFYNEHHLDYRGLIPMGLALEAPEGMYKTE